MKIHNAPGLVVFSHIIHSIEFAFWGLLWFRFHCPFNTKQLYFQEKIYKNLPQIGLIPVKHVSIASLWMCASYMTVLESRLIHNYSMLYQCFNITMLSLKIFFHIMDHDYYNLQLWTIFSTHLTHLSTSDTFQIHTFWWQINSLVSNEVLHLVSPQIINFL